MYLTKSIGLVPSCVRRLTILPSDGPPRCRPGDLWQLGSNRLICGSALDRDVIAALMDGSLAQMVFTDPPYNVPIQGHVGGSGAIKHVTRILVSRDFAEFKANITPQRSPHGWKGSTGRIQVT
jgi:hypothetical protein